jgi:hypothetical protein
VAISAAPSNTICANSTITFTASATNTGSAPIYDWLVNGVSTGINNIAYSSSALLDNDVITVNLTSNSNCASTLNASNNFTVTVKPLLTPTITVSSTNTLFCVGSPITFTAANALAGNSPIYKWKIDGNNVGGNVPTFTTSLLPAGAHTITCRMVSNSTVCISTYTVNSNSYVINVDTLVDPIITIAPDTNNFCYGLSVTFTATYTNGGAAPNFKWKRNGGNVGTSLNTITLFNLNNGDIVECILTSDYAGCLSKQKDTSNKVTMIVKPLVTPSVTIKADTNNVCQDSTIHFKIITLNNGGVNPMYQWKLNGANIAGATTNSLTTNTLNNTDKIVLELTSNAACATPPVVSSNTITAIINPIVTPVAKIVASDTTICIGTMVNFTASGTGFGTGTTYKWFWNSLQHGGTTNAYNNPLLENLDSVYVVMTSNAKCRTKDIDTSDAIVMHVDDNITPFISIAQSVSTGAIGSAIKYTATTSVIAPYNIQWYRNGVFVTNTGSNNVWNTTIQTQKDTVYAKVLNFTGCYTSTNATSDIVFLRGAATSIGGQNPVNFVVYPNPTSAFATVEGVEVGDQVLLYDITGKLIFKDVVSNTGAYQLNLQSYTNGLYQAKFIRGSAQWIVRLEKN